MVDGSGSRDATVWQINKPLHYRTASGESAVLAGEGEGRHHKRTCCAAPGLVTGSRGDPDAAWEDRALLILSSTAGAHLRPLLGRRPECPRGPVVRGGDRSSGGVLID